MSDIFYIKSKRDGKWKPVREKWVDGEETMRAAAEAKGFELGTKVEKGGKRGVVPNNNLERAMADGAVIYDRSGQRDKFLTDDSHKYKNEKEGSLEAFAENTANQVMFGQLPRVKAFAAEQIEGKDYDKALAQYRDELAKRYDENSGAAIAGDVVGGILSPNVVGKVGLAAKGVKGLGSLAKLAKAKGAGAGILKGGIDSAVRASGATDDAASIVGDAALGGALGSMSGFLGKGKDAAARAAEERAAKAAGVTKGQIKKLGIDRVREIGRYLLDSGTVKAGRSADDMAAQLSGRAEEVGAGLDEVYDALDATGVKLTPEAVTNLLQKSPDLAPDLLKQKLMKSGKGLYDDLASDVLTGGSVGAKRARKLKQMIAKHLPTSKATDDTVKQDTAKAAYGQLKKIPELLAEYTDDAGIKGRLSDLNSEYSKLADAAKMVNEKVSSDAGNRLLGLTDQIHLAPALQNVAKSRFGVDSLKDLVISMGIKKAGDLFGNQTMAVGLDKMAKNADALNKAGNLFDTLQRSTSTGMTSMTDSRRDRARQRHLQD